MSIKYTSVEGAINLDLFDKLVEKMKTLQMQLSYLLDKIAYQRSAYHYKIKGFLESRVMEIQKKI